MITRPHEVQPGVTILYGSRFCGRHPYVNAIELSGDHTILVDPGLCHEEYLAPRVDRIDLVVNTHCHPDHVSLNAMFPCERACHASGRRYVEDPAVLRDAQGFPSQELRDEWDRIVERLYRPRPCRVQRTLHEGDVLDTGRLRFRVLHTPGHTCDHIALFEEQEGILIAGDYDLNPFSAAYTSALSDLDDWYASVDRLIALEPRVVITGHAAVVDDAAPARLVQYRADIRAREESLQLFLKEPRTLEEVHSFARDTFYSAMSSRRPIGHWFFEVSVSYHVERLLRIGCVRLMGRHLVAA